MQTENLMSLEGATSIIKEMHAVFGRKFIAQWESVERDDLIKTAQRVLAGLTAGQVKRGLEIMYKERFVPSLPEFRAFCLQGHSQFLDMDTAYLNAANEKYTDAATYEAARRTGFFEIRSRAESSTKPSFKKHYEAVCAELIDNPNAYRLPESKQIEQAPAAFVRKDHSFFDQLKRGIA